MIKTVIGDLFESQAQTLANPTNCMGVMGKGLALEFKKRYPLMFEDYRERHKAKKLKIGVPYVYRESIPWILNFPTKEGWRSPSKIEYISNGLQLLVDYYKEWGIKSLACPALGCGLGGLDFKEVWTIMEFYFKQMSIPIEVIVTERERRMINNINFIVPDENRT